MLDKNDENLKKFQENVDYWFKNESLLKNALTTPQLGKELDVTDYNTLEILGDAILKLIFISKKIKEGIKDAGEITKTKQCLENDETLSKISEDYFNLNNFIFKSEKQEIKRTRILADVLEALCGAIFIDSNSDLKVVEEKIVNKFYKDWEKIIQNSSILNKNKLLEHIQKKHRITPIIETEFKVRGADHTPKWIAFNPKILDHQNEILIHINKKLKSKSCKTKKEAEQDLYFKILKYLKSSGL